VGGVGARVAQTLADADVAVPVRTFGLPAAFLDHGTREEILASCGLTGQAIARAVTEVITAGEPAESHSTTQQA
jgi:1-deoxy-D-xylulose-5-phosphate synthase